MKSNKLYFFSLAFLMLITSSVLLGKNKENKKNFREPIGDITQAEVQLDIGMAECLVMSGSKKDLFEISAEFDYDYIEPDLEVEKDGNKAYVYFKTEHKKKWRHDCDDCENEYEICLNPNVELFLKCEMGMADNEFDLTDLNVKRFDLEAGLAESHISLSSPNKSRTSKVNIECGLGALESENMGYLRFDELDIEVGMGSAELDLGGFEGKANIYISAGMGSVDLTIPDNVGVKVYSESTIFASLDLKKFEKVSKGYYVSENYDSKKSTLDIEVEIGMGSMSIDWK